MINLFRRNKEVVVESVLGKQEIQFPNVLSGKHTFCMHADAIFHIEEVGDKVIIAGREYTRAEAKKQLADIIAGLQIVCDNIAS